MIVINNFLDIIEDLHSRKFWGFQKFDSAKYLYREVFDYFNGRRHHTNIDLMLGILFHIESFKLIPGKNKSLFFKPLFYNSRKDMLDTIEGIINLTESGTIESSFDKKSFDFSFLKYLVLIFQWNVQLKRKKYDKALKKGLLVALLYNYKFLCWLSKEKDNIKSSDFAIVLNDQSCEENLFIQYMKSLNIPTVTLQHGVYYYNPNNNDFLYFPHIYKNLTADYIFVWGEYERQQELKYGINVKRVIPVGAPKYVTLSGVIHQNKKSNKVFGVFLDYIVDHTEKSNISLIQIANAFAQKNDFQYLVKIHPNTSINDFSEYFDYEYCLGVIDKEQTVCDFCKTIDFALVSQSSVLFELFILEKPVFRYINPNSFDVYSSIQWGTFSSSNDLFQLYSRYINNKENYLLEERRLKDFCCCSGNISENYINAFNEIKKRNI